MIFTFHQQLGNLLRASHEINEIHLLNPTEEESSQNVESLKMSTHLTAAIAFIPFFLPSTCSSSA